MATTQTLAKIERVDPRTVWANEAQDFTPWLKEHIDELGEALGLEELEVESVEAPVGGFSLDILAREVGRNRPVIVENQLEDTNHSHLGQLLTYAAGYDAGVVVWIAKKFRDEHKAALDMLNRRTDQDTEFYGVVIELWRIADSPPALNFKVVSAPNEWGRRAKHRAGKQERDDEGRRERYRAFFQALIDGMKDGRVADRGTKAKTSHYCRLRRYDRGLQSAACFRQRLGVARVELYIDRGDVDWNKAVFDGLKQDQVELERALGDLTWDRLDDKRASRISARRPASIDDGEKALEELRSWMTEKLTAFRDAFEPRLAQLVAQMADGISDDDELEEDPEELNE